MENSFFRKRSMEHINSPEQLHDYMRVTSPRLWMILCAIIPIMIGFIIYAATTRMESTMNLKCRVEENIIMVHVPVSDADVLRTRMPVRIGGKTGYVQSVDRMATLQIQIALDSGETLEDGFYIASFGDLNGSELFGPDGTFLHPESLFFLNVTNGVCFTYDTSEEMRARLKNDCRIRLTEQMSGQQNSVLGTVTGYEMMDSASVTVQLDGEGTTLADGVYDLEIVTESTTPISFLLN